MPLVWRPVYLYQDTNMNENYFTELLYEDYPNIQFIYIVDKINEYSFKKILELKYPKNKIKIILISLFIKLEILTKLIENNSDKTSYFKKITYITPKTNIDFKKEIKEIIKNNTSDYILFLYNDHIIENKKLIKLLIKKQKDIISPMLLQKGTQFSNFWGGIGPKGFYRRSWDYMEIVNYEKTGYWNVPYINGTILIKNCKFEIISNLMEEKIYNEDFDMYFCRIMRNKCIFMFTTNLDQYGYILKS